VLLEVQEQEFVDQDHQPQAGRFARRPAGARKLPIMTGRRSACGRHPGSPAAWKDRVALRVLDAKHVQRDTASVNQRPQVSVPMIVGMTVLAGNRAAGAAGVVLAPVNADGPPLGALLWPHEEEYVIASQSPVGGTTAL